MNSQLRVGVLSALLRNRRGSTAVEFAFVAPVLFAIIFGTIDLGRYAWTLSTIQNSADEAVRLGGVRHYSLTATETAARNNLFAQDVASFAVAATSPTIGGITYLQVQVTHTYDFMFPMSIFWPTGTMFVTSRFPLT